MNRTWSIVFSLFSEKKNDAIDGWIDMLYTLLLHFSHSSEWKWFKWCVAVRNDNALFVSNRNGIFSMRSRIDYHFSMFFTTFFVRWLYTNEFFKIHYFYISCFSFLHYFSRRSVFRFVSFLSFSLFLCFNFASVHLSCNTYTRFTCARCAQNINF